ncbi:uncharacterized protein LOC127831238 [Dreissena polymorpha]|uniref:uncharacterized protein LOC127831238 n=1 Tax=Dreissena polymorpha TaxID=45954 RepID=UPI002264CFCA|nr:uncharacterized protein LOC127831238 [Dreissena polymorpha]
MFESRPELIKVFSNFDSKDVSELRDSRLLHDHALRVMATVEAVISQLEDMPEVAKTLKEVGEVILPHFLTAIRQHLDSSWSNDVEIAWTKLFDVIIFYLTDGDVI